MRLVPLLFLLAFLTGCEGKLTSTGQKLAPADVPIYEEGARAYRLGVPAVANPSGRTWLAGWMDAKEKEQEDAEDN